MSPLMLLACAHTGPGRTLDTLPAFADPPPLTVLIVVDQLRADYLTRYLDALPRTDGIDGFTELIDRGSWYVQAEYEVLQAMTGPGHATLSTGAWPGRHGVTLNGWVDAATGDKVYCVGDADSHLLGNPDEPGVSPRVLTAPTLGDTMKTANPESKVASVAIKDRAAVLMGGYSADATVFYDWKTGKWNSSSWFGDTLPAWVDLLNTAMPDDIKGRDGLTATVDLAIATLHGMELGLDAAPDLLAVSFSSFDITGHGSGPGTETMKDMFLAQDAAIASLLQAIDQQVGLDEVVIALSGDHGAAENPNMTAPKMPAGYYEDSPWAEDLEGHLTEVFGKPPTESWLAGTYVANFWFWDVVRDDPRWPQIREVARERLLQQELVEEVVVADALFANQVPGPIGIRAHNQWVPGRSADLTALTLAYTTRKGAIANHHTHFSYDVTVPLVLSGPGVRQGIEARQIGVVDVAPTLAYLVGLLPPAASEGRVLHEVME